MLFRSIIHEQVEALMQIMFRENRNRYYSIKELIFSNPNIIRNFLELIPDPRYEDNNFLFNDLMAKALEIGVLAEGGLVIGDDYKDEHIKAQEARFYLGIKPILDSNKHNYFREGLYVSDEDIIIRSEKIRRAINAGMIFYQTASSGRNIITVKKIVPEGILENYRFDFAKNHASRVLEISEALAEHLRFDRSEERSEGKECRSRWAPYH